MSSELHIPSLHAWEWRAEKLLREGDPDFRKARLPENVSTFFSHLERYWTVPPSMNDGVDWEHIQPKQPLVEYLGSLVVRKRIPLKSYPHVHDTEVTVSSVDAFRDALSVPITSSGSAFYEQEITDKFRSALDYLITVTQDGAIYEGQDAGQFYTRPAKISLGALIDSFDGDFESPQVKSSLHAYNRQIRSLPFSEIIETSLLHNTIQAIDFNSVQPE